MGVNTKNRMNNLQHVDNTAEDLIAMGRPYRVEVEIEGVCPILFHRYSPEEVEAKANSPKNSKKKKEDNPEAYVYRDEAGDICLPGEYLRQALIETGRYRQDPRSPRKSARDLYKAIILSLTDLATLGKDTWDFIDQRRAVVQRSGVTRRRPAFQAGWHATLTLMVQTPEYLAPDQLNSALVDAGRLVGVGDFRPTYGRFNVIQFKVLEDG